MRGIPRFPEANYPPGPRMRPSQLILKPDGIRLVRDWSNHVHGLNGAPMSPEVDYGTTYGAPALLRSRASVAGLDLKECFSRWSLVHAPTSFLGARHPVAGRFEVFLRMLSGCGSSAC